MPPRLTHALVLALAFGLASASSLAACAEDDAAPGPVADSGSDGAVVPDDAASSGDATDPGDAEHDATAPEASAPDDAGVEPADPGGPDAPGPVACAPAESVVSFPTSDGVTLEADHWPAADSGGPAVVLLHMIPPSHDRTNYPPELRERLAERGLTVLNVDRRGAGGSGGVAAEAYTGPNGKLDAEAAMAFLMASACPPDPTRVAFVGASNGTTTVVDWTHFAATDGDEATVPPKAIALLTGGSYTDNQTDFGAEHALFGALPVHFLYSFDERAWSVAQAVAPTPERADAWPPTSWVFSEVDPGAHGTQMFGTQPDSMDLLADWLADTL